MGNHCKLAIVIPAYKSLFFEEALESIANQTDKRFRLYIGDDNSPEEIGSIVDQFKGRFDYVYKRFDNNLGGENLVAQWERCIKMTSDEDWIWLFSDDDYMDPNCVEDFYNQLNRDEKFDLYHFNVRIVDKDSRTKYTCELPSVFSSDYLFVNKLKGKINIFAVEFIFSRHIYMKFGGFQEFDMAWGSDTATWMKFGVNGIKTIIPSCVNWRSSGFNITKADDNSDIAIRKLKASNSFLIWSKQFWKDQSKNFSLFTDMVFIKRLHGATKILSVNDCINVSDNYFKEKGPYGFFLKVIFYFYYVFNKLFSR